MLKQKARQGKIALSFFKVILTQSLCWMELKVHRISFLLLDFIFPLYNSGDVMSSHILRPYFPCFVLGRKKRTAYSELDVTENTLFHCSSRNNSGKVPHHQECRW